MPTDMLLDDRMDPHLARLHEAVTWSRMSARQTLDTLMHRFQARMRNGWR